MRKPVVEAVEEHKETLEKIAADDLPLSEDCQRLLEEYEKEVQ